jgi:nucleotide-binding universal stress UspA family protein
MDLPRLRGVCHCQDPGRQELTLAVAEAVGQTGRPVEVRTKVAQCHSAEVLLRAATGAQSLVVGSRGHGTFAGILLSSVNQHCI